MKRTGTRTGILLLFCVLLTALQLPVFAEEEPEIDEVVEYIELDGEDDITFPAVGKPVRGPGPHAELLDAANGHYG